MVTSKTTMSLYSSFGVHHFDEVQGATAYIPFVMKAPKPKEFELIDVHDIETARLLAEMSTP